MSYIGLSPSCETCEIFPATILRSCPFAVLNDMVKGKTFRHFAKDAYIFRQDDPVQGVHCLYSGEVALVKNDPRKGELEVNAVRPGDMIGIHSLHDDVYNTSARAKGEVTLCYIPKDTLISVMQRDASTYINAMQNICAQMEHIEADSRGLVEMSVKRRVIQSLIALLMGSPLGLIPPSLG